MSETLRGQLLVAAPILHDPNFHRTVVLVAEHGEEGAMGLVLNRPTDTSVGDALPELVSLTGVAEPDDLFSDDADGLWSAVLRRQGGSYALLALMPPDPSLN